MPSIITLGSRVSAKVGPLLEAPARDPSVAPPGNDLAAVLEQHTTGLSLNLLEVLFGGFTGMIVTRLQIIFQLVCEFMEKRENPQDPNSVLRR